MFLMKIRTYLLFINTVYMLVFIPGSIRPVRFGTVGRNPKFVWPIWVRYFCFFNNSMRFTEFETIHRDKHDKQMILNALTKLGTNNQKFIIKIPYRWARAFLNCFRFFSLSYISRIIRLQILESPVVKF